MIGLSTQEELPSGSPCDSHYTMQIVVLSSFYRNKITFCGFYPLAKLLFIRILHKGHFKPQVFVLFFQPLNLRFKTFNLIHQAKN